jgi:predicted DNA-binding transcriptional regulator AlpA
MADRWLDIAGVAHYLSVLESRIPRLRRDGLLPEPSYHLGERSPRWWSGDLDRAMNPGTGSTNHRQAVEGLINEIKEEGRARRQARAG